VLDIPFNPAFFDLLHEHAVDIRAVDPGLAASLEDLDACIDHSFTYPGIPDCQLEPHTPQYTSVVDNDSHIEFKNLVGEYTCGRKHFRTQVREFHRGFNLVMPWSSLDNFSPECICRMVSGEGPAFTIEDIRQNVVIEDGYDENSQQIQWVTDVLAEMPPQDQRRVLQFVTGFSSLPIGGLACLTPKFRIAKGSSDSGVSAKDMPLPSASTCTNCLILPEYPSKEVMKYKLAQASTEGAGCFTLP
jgi:hypothetical protein